jgi:YHS domain-containing protein
MRIISSFANTMTPARQQRKRYRVGGAAIAGLLLALSTGLPVTSAATTERIVVDWHTGLAIGGYDPVASFTDGKPIAGRPDFELRYGGAVWRFCNVGNRTAFAARPDVYVPQFGGYDPVGVARGLAVAGSPDHWLISGERLFLFYDQARREKFSADPERAIAAADHKWPEVSRTLSP